MNRFVVFSFVILFLSSCSNKTGVWQEDVVINNDNIYSIDEAHVKGTRKLLLSELVDTLIAIPLENNEDAFFKFRWLNVSDNFIAVRADESPVKLFDMQGKFIGDVGSLGQGPGEYNSTSDVLIDEEGNTIYVAPFMGNVIHKYDLKGTFIGSIKFAGMLYKPKLYRNSDGTVSLVHLSFRDKDAGSTFATFNYTNADSIRYGSSNSLSLNFKTSMGEKRGIENEIWSYRNTDHFAFSNTARDTMYIYDGINNTLSPIVSYSFKKEQGTFTYPICMDLPNHIFINMVGGAGRSLILDKATGEVYRVEEFVNDLFYNLPMAFRFQDGYFFSIYEPEGFAEKVDTFLEEHPDSKDSDYLKECVRKFSDNVNNVIFLGRVKQ